MKWNVRAMLHFFVLGMSNSWVQFRETKQVLQDIPQFRTLKIEFGKNLIKTNNLFVFALNLQDGGGNVKREDHPTDGQLMTLLLR